MGIAREGYPFILTAVLLALLAWGWGGWWAGALPGAFALAFAGFFRDPERRTPGGEGLIISPADGRVVEVKEVAKGRLWDGVGTRVSIFLSVLDVHVNRAPVPGRVEQIQYQKGNFYAAYLERASEQNEQNALRITDAKGRSLTLVQIAGVLARRIVCYVRQGDALSQGQRLGLIMFGSRVDLFLPRGLKVEVVKGQRVKGGETVIGRFV